jgi:hypothetical protein
MIGQYSVYQPDYFASTTGKTEKNPGMENE